MRFQAEIPPSRALSAVRFAGRAAMGERKKRYSASDIAAELGVTTRTWYHWIRKGCVRSAPVVETMGDGRGGRLCFWHAEDLRRGREILAATRRGVRLRDIAQP
jgi:hypothetical protein